MFIKIIRVTFELIKVTNMASPKISNYPTHIDSPFVVNVSIREYTPKTEETVVEDTLTGKVYIQKEIPKNMVIPNDDTPYIKVFKGNSDKRMRLPEASSRMLEFIMEHIKPNKQEICIPSEHFLKFASYKETNGYVYYKAVEGLLREGIIARQVGSNQCFFVNPNVLFNGDRTKLPNTIQSADKFKSKLPNDNKSYKEQEQL